MWIGVKFFVSVGVGFSEEVSEGFFVFGFGGGLLLGVGDYFFGRRLADAVACVLLDGFDDGEDALFGFGHGGLDFKGTVPVCNTFGWRGIASRPASV